MDNGNRTLIRWRSDITIKNIKMKAYIKAIEYYLPEKILTNEELVKDFPEWNAEKVSSKTGILERHVSTPEETASDLAVKAAKKLEKAGTSFKDVDYLLFCTQSPDYHLPTTACLIQDRLGLSNKIGALDFNLGCSGYIYGLSLAKALVISGIAKNVLLLTAETYTKYIHVLDKGNRSLFGDGAAATLVSTDGFAEIGEFALGTDGRGFKNLIVKTGASRFPNKIHEDEIPHDEGGYIASANNLYMNGSEIFNFTLDTVPPLISDCLNKNNITKDDISLFVLHQANKFILNTIRKVAGIPKDKFYIDLEKTGNTVSSTLPIALKDAMNKSMICKNSKILISGFGVGYSYGACTLSF